jgi:hypothetical protein
VSWRVWFNRLSAIGWAVAGIAAFPLGWAYSVAFVTIASIYANVKTDWGAAESARAADGDAKLDEIKALLERLAAADRKEYNGGMATEQSTDAERKTLRGQELVQLVVLTFSDADGREWLAGASITRLRPLVPIEGVAESKQLVEGDEMKLLKIKVVGQ